jgi:hypothetical protein
MSSPVTSDKLQTYYIYLSEVLVNPNSDNIEILQIFERCLKESCIPIDHKFSVENAKDAISSNQINELYLSIKSVAQIG